MRENSLEVVMCCLPQDLPVARIAIDGIEEYICTKSISIVTKANSFKECRRVLGGGVELLDERDLSGGVSFEELRARRDIEGFPKRVGWYFQQLVKLGFSLRQNDSKYYLIWDCDTVPLRPIDFFSTDGHPMYVLSQENHPPYLETFKRLFGYLPQYIGSFISQHMVIDKTIAREMLHELANRHPHERSWSSAIMNNLAPIASTSLFSEYETYGYYALSKYPEKMAFRELKWLREGAAYTNTTSPSPKQLSKLSEIYDYAAFESWHLSRFQRRSNGLVNLVRRIPRMWSK